MPYWHKQHYTEVIPTPRKKKIKPKYSSLYYEKKMQKQPQFI